jgi:hypothetical protein
MQKDLIVGAVSSNYELSDVVNWSNSIRMSGFNGDVVVFCYNFEAMDAIPEYFRKQNFVVILPEYDMFGNEVEIFETHTGRGNEFTNYTLIHQQRFFHYWQFLHYSTEPNQYRFVITTDVRDVVFQTNPSLFLDNHVDDAEYDFLASSENVLAENEPWFTQMATRHFGGYVFGETLAKRPIYNVGTFAGRQHAFKRMCLDNYFISLAFHPNTLPAVGDQTGFNFLINTSYAESTLKLGPSSSWGCQSGVMLNPQFKDLQVESTDPINVRDGVVYYGDTPFVILHQYDRVPDLIDVVNELYSEIEEI